ncbi:MAG: CotS family spore coat protein [Bacillota bacterium]|jgi:CotS family spore coat protein
MARRKRIIKRNEAQMILELLEKDQVLAEWDLIIKKIKKIGNDYKIKTQRGQKLLKVGFEEGRILFMHLALEHLARNGCYKGIPRLIPTKYGDYYVKTDLGIYYLTDWIEGKEVKRKDLNQVTNFVRFLAEIHLAGKNFQSVPYWTIRERWDDISQQITNKIHKVNNNMGKLPREFQDAWLTYENIAQKAYNLLKSSGYGALQETAQRDMTLCHRQFTPRNGFFSKETATILCWEHCAYGVQLGDLVHYMQKVMPSFGWNNNVGEQVIKAYHLVKPLSREEVMTLGAALMFPTAFVKLVDKFLKGKIEKDNIHIKLEKVKEQEEKKSSFLEDFFARHGLKGFCSGESGHQVWSEEPFFGFPGNQITSEDDEVD